MTSYSFNIKNAVALLHTLNEAVDDYLADRLSSRKALECAMISWHLADWIYKEHQSIRASFPTLKIYKDYLTTQCRALSYMQDISNGTKHWEVTHYIPKVRSTGKHCGDFSDDFVRRDFNVSHLKITLLDETNLYFEEEIEKVRNYWNTYFTDTLRGHP